MFPSAVILLAGLLQPGQPTPRFEQLDSGLRLVIVEDHALPLISVQLWYRVGAACDPPDKPGLSAVARALLEHRDDAALKLRAAGVRFESRTLPDACYFSSVMPPNLVKHVLDIEAERVKPLAATTEMLQLGLNAAARDYAELADDPNHVVMRQLLAAMFPEHPYQHPPGFVAESVRDLSVDDINVFLRHWFVPANATLFVIGDVSTVQVRDQVRRRFGDLEPTGPPRRAGPKRIDSEQIHISASHPPGAGATGITIAWRTPPLGYFENAALDVLMQRLCNSVDGPLGQRLAEIGCGSPRWKRHAWRDAGMLVLSVDPREGSGLNDASKIETLIKRELARSVQEIPAEIEHNRARTLARREALDRLADFAHRAHELAACQVIGGDVLLARFAVSRIASVGVQDLRQAAAGLIEARTVFLRRSATPSETDLAPADESRPLTSQPSAEPGLANGASELPGKPMVRQLDNGVSISVRRLRGVGELAEVSTLVTMPQPPSESLQALLDVGSTRHSAQQLRDYLSYHGLDLSPLRRDSRVGLRSRGPTSHVAQMIELQSELLRFPAASQAGAIGQISAVEILVTGDVDAADVIPAARMAWGDWRASGTED